MALTFEVLTVFLTIVVYKISCSNEIDSNGYVLYCPRKGRFGVQVDHFLGALAFASGLNRTLALPPWVEHRTGHSKSIQVPFDSYFEIEPLKNYHRVITMESFMQVIAPVIWPKGKRKVFCYSARNKNDCNAIDGNPSGPFWDTFDVVDFDEYVDYNETSKNWNEKFRPDEYPVLAFTRAPAPFPVQEENKKLQEYLVWNDSVFIKAKDFIKSMEPKGPFVGIDLRNGMDWVRACELIEHRPLLFAAPQCLGYKNEFGNATRELCFPSKDIILKQLRRVVKDLRARSVFVASDNDHMIQEIDKSLEDLKVKAYKLSESELHVDLAILSLSNHFIGNCISSFTAFVKRERDLYNSQSSFWAFPMEQGSETVHSQLNHDEF